MCQLAYLHRLITVAICVFVCLCGLEIIKRSELISLNKISQMCIKGYQLNLNMIDPYSCGLVILSVLFSLQCSNDVGLLLNSFSVYLHVCLFTIMTNFFASNSVTLQTEKTKGHNIAQNKDFGDLKEITKKKKTSKKCFILIHSFSFSPTAGLRPSSRFALLLSSPIFRFQHPCFLITTRKKYGASE